MGSSASSIENGAGGQGRPSTPGPEEIGGACRPPVPEEVDRQQALPTQPLFLQTTPHAHPHTPGGATPAPREGRADHPLRFVRRGGRFVPLSPPRLIFWDVWARQARGFPQTAPGGRATHSHGNDPPPQGSAQPAHPWEKAPMRVESGHTPPWETWSVRPVGCLLYTSPSPRDRTRSRMPSSA